MVLMGKIKEIFVEDHQILCVVETGTGQTVTAVVMSPPGTELHPVRGDLVFCQSAGQDIVVTASWSLEVSTEPGGVILFSRDSGGNLKSSIYLQADGSVMCSNDNGSFELNANGQVELNGHLTVDP
jgi:hypothetical protein